jgi:chloramphenicol 3-O phosphotransferase
MAGRCIVLNGASSSGKTTIACALQELWPGPNPLQVSGFDTFLSCQPREFYGIDGGTAAGFSWRATTLGGVATQQIVAGPLGTALVRAAQAYWRACAEEGFDQLIDDVWLTREQALGLKDALEGFDVLWVGVHCPLEVLEARERARSDRPVGQARGQAHLVHSWTSYDLELDTSRLSPAECAQQILAALGLTPRCT